MASRGTYLSRSTGRPELVQESSVTAPAPTTSKIPTSSWFSRGKKERPLNAQQARSRALPDGRVEDASTATRTAVPPIPRNPRGHGLGITTSTSSSHDSSTQEHRQRNVLRRKITSQDQRAHYTRTSSSASSYGPQVQRQYETASTPDSTSKAASQSILGLAMPSASTSTSFLPSSTMMNPGQATSSSRMAVYQNRKAPHTLSTQNLPPPTPSFAQSSGSSTRYSESPSSLSHTSTPTSMSSYSPSISLPSKSPLKLRQSSPTRSRPPVTRFKMQNNHDGDVDARGLAAVRESVTSSSSSSTVKGTERGENNQHRQTAYRLSPPPPSPPVRGLMTKKVSSRSEMATQIIVNQTNPRRQATHGSAPQEEETHTLESSTAPSHQISSPPPRPSREGTPQLDSYIVPSPVIHSNLTRIATTGHKRRESTERAGARAELPVTSRSGLRRSPSNPPTLSARPSRLPSPSPSSISSTLVSTSQNRINDPRGSEDPPLGQSNSAVEAQFKDTHTLSATSSRSSSRFGLFSRRTRSPMERSTHEGTDRAPKKGPIAGTGHEGYGKYAKRGRSSSMSTSASRGRSTSTTGTANSSIARTPLSRKSSTTSRDKKDMDDFLLERLAPVYITGGGMADNGDGAEMYRTSSGESSTGIVARDIQHTARPPFSISDAAQRPAISTGKGDARSLRRELRTIPHGFGHGSGDHESTGESSRSSSHSRPTLAARRSLHRSQLFKEAEPMKLPTPINTRVLAPSPMGSRDTAPLSAMTTDSTTLLSDELSEGREGNWLKPKRAGKRGKSPMKWNFFQRALGSPKKSSEHAQRNDLSKDIGELPATVSRLTNSRPLPYYAMLDLNEQEGFENVAYDTDIDRTMQNDIGISQDPPEIIEDEPSPQRQKNKISLLLPSPPTFPAEFTNTQDLPVQTRVDLQQPGVSQGAVRAADEPPKPRVPRLQQIGRIPRVVSKRDRLHNPPPQSFSRPFARPSPQGDQATSSRVVESDPKGSVPPGFASNTELTQPDMWHSEASAKSLYTTTRDEFLMFPPRKFSQISASSSSGAGSLAAAIATTAIVPEPHAAPGEDEVWNEYNDFLDTVESPAPLPESSVSPFEHGHSGTRMAPAPLHIRKDSQSDIPTTLSMSTKDVAAAHGLPSPPPMSTLLAPRQSTEMTSSPMSFTDFIAGYESRNRASATSKHQSLSTGSQYSTDSIPGKEGNTHPKRSTQIMAEKTEDTSSTQSNLRFSALMTSRWLSFGRVLFSPAHTEIQSTRQDRVLVLDGLGNDDWSFYCSLTYPSATIYNLSPSLQNTSNHHKREARGANHYYDAPPSNHRQIYHTSIAHPFPFPKAFFTAAVFRFPVAGAESAYASAIAEFKRVLQPGGYLELSILDLDMVNMGNRARRAVRSLKVDLQAMNADVSLKPNSDNIQKLLGRRGFENLKSCMVDVPVAGHISSSRAGSADFEKGDRDEEMSLGDMLRDESRRGDESITTMVAKVGRWWYSRCYEVGVLPPPDNGDGDGDEEGGRVKRRRSIWDDKQLLRECERRETGLKLLICYAQKPVGMKRRTVSM